MMSSRTRNLTLMSDSKAILKPFPAFPGFAKALGPGIVWLALAQGSGELIWWPYMIAKYGLAFLFLLVPACLLQFPVNYQIGCYTLLTGESIFQGFIRLNRTFAVCLWLLAAFSFLWFGAFASAGGTSLAALTDFPHGWARKAQTLFWAYASMAVFLYGLLASRRVYRFIEKLMTVVAFVTFAGLILACSHPQALSALPVFLKGLLIPGPLAKPWDPADSTKLLTAITFAGLGGFWTLFYSYWLREKGTGMSAYSGHMSTALRPEPAEEVPGMLAFAGTRQELGEIKKWKRFLILDAGMGIVGNIATTLMTCLLAYALLHPQGLLPEKYEIAVVQARFFEATWGPAGRLVFLFVAACFLSDTWITTLDAVSRMHTDFLKGLFPALKNLDPRKSYTFFVFLLSAITSITILFDEPGPLILISAVSGFAGTVAFSLALLFLNHRLLPGQLVPAGTGPGRAAFALHAGATLIYLGLAAFYFGKLLKVF